MLKVSLEQLELMGLDYPGIREQVISREEAEFPLCSSCGSPNTATVSVGAVDRSMSIVAATTRIKLVPNGPKPGEYFCNDCREFWESD